ncbi:MAG: hypothetical protein ACTHMH_05040 [Curtobacterium sp.]
MERTTSVAAVAAAALGLSVATLPAAASAAVPEPRDPSAPGCSTTTMVADHTKGWVYWTIECTEDRTVVVDATAFSGTPDDHVIVDEQQVTHFVAAGEQWTDFVEFPTDGVDQLRGQAVTFVSPSDPVERPAIIGGATG